MDELLCLVPGPGEAINWKCIIEGPLKPYLKAMEATEQEPCWHGEGNVLVHTQRVCEVLVTTRDWQQMDKPRREVLFVAALLHDIGKPDTTRRIDGRLSAPKHSPHGASLARTLLWQTFGLAGTPEKQAVREAVCALIQYHGRPLHLLDRTHADTLALGLASIGEMTGLFSLEMLALLAEADVRGRICQDGAELLEKVILFRMLCQEAGCFQGPFAFPSAYSRFACLSGRNVVPGQPLYDDTWGQVLIMCGLPGTGKDTWISRHYPDLPVISLDAIRQELGIAPGQPQGKVITKAREKAKEYLRIHQPFIWNATQLTQTLRRNQVELFTRYGASVCIQYLETSWEQQLERNSQRPQAVPEAVIGHMLAQLSPPMPTEAHEVTWLCI